MIAVSPVRTGIAVTFGVAFFALVAGSCFAASDRLQPLFGNTLIAKDGGIVSHFWYKRDHTFTGTVPAYAYALKGTWVAKEDGTICRTFDPALPTVKNPDCGPIGVREIGEKYTSDEHSEMLVAGIR